MLCFFCVNYYVIWHFFFRYLSPYTHRLFCFAALACRIRSPSNKCFVQYTANSFFIAVFGCSIIPLYVLQMQYFVYLFFAPCPPCLAKNRRRELLQAGADPNAATAAGETPLELAELSGSFYVVRELLLAGAEPLAPAAAIPRGDEAGVAAAYSNADAAYGDYDDDEDTEGSWR